MACAFRRGYFRLAVSQRHDAALFFDLPGLAVPEVTERRPRTRRRSLRAEGKTKLVEVPPERGTIRTFELS
jgi:hypothetical protein